MSTASERVVQEPQGAPEGQDPSTYALRMAQQAKALAEGEAETRQAQRKRKQAPAARRDDDGTIVLPDGRRVTPRAVFPAETETDFTDIKLQDGSNPVKQGWCTRWVRTVDANGKTTMARVHEYQRFGYEIIKDKDGLPLEKMSSYAMQGPPEALAARILKYQRVHARDTVQDTYDIVDTINREAGREVLAVRSENQGTTRRMAVKGVIGED